MRIPKFWTALDKLSEAAASRRDWSILLGNEFDWLVADEPDCALPLIRSVGTLAETIGCPSPGGDGCPRRIVHHADGRIRAVCGDSLKLCDDLDLERRDIMLYALDGEALARSIAQALQLSHRKEQASRMKVRRIGMREVAAGHGFSVYMAVPGPFTGADFTSFGEVMSSPGPRLLIVPTASSISPAITAELDRKGAAHMTMEALFDLDNKGQLRTDLPLSVLFAELAGDFASTLVTQITKPAWSLPSGARWSEITIRFVEQEFVNVTFRGQTRRLGPADLQMRNAKNDKPDTAWAFLKILAGKNGRISAHSQHIADTSKYQKQKQKLSKALRAAFGIDDEPIQVIAHEYVGRFMVSAEDLSQGVQGQVQRNFASRPPSKAK